MQGLTTAGRPVGLGEYGTNLLRLSQCVERWDCELRRAGETQPEDRKVRAQGSKSRRGSAKFAPSGSLPALFFQPPANQLAFEFGEVVDEQLAFEVIHLVLDAHSQQPVGLHFKGLAVAA